MAWGPQVTRCTHGGAATNLAVGARCPYCAQTVTVDAAPLVSGHRGEVPGSVNEPLDGTPRHIAPGVSSDGNALAGPPPPGCSAPGATIAATAPTPPPGPSPARGIPSANAQPGPSLLDLLDATPLARATDPDTAHHAARAQAGRLTADMRLVLAAHVAAGERGLTGPELAAATRRTYEQIGPRRKPLERAGLVEQHERRPKDPTQPHGSLVWAYRATAAGRDAYAAELATSAA